MKINILYEDSQLLVCEKPAGVPTQTANLQDQDMVSFVKNEIAAREKTGKVPYLALIHRLDQPVQGILLFGKTPESGKELSRQIVSGDIQKYYYAVVNGDVPNEGIWKNYVKKKEKGNVSEIVDDIKSGGKLSVLHFETIKREEQEALVKIMLKTGRHHQIRLQFAYRGFPLVGDRKYGKAVQGSIALCAYKIELKHPETKKKIDFEIIPQGKEFQKFLSLH